MIMGIMEKIIERARADKQKIVLPEAILEVRTIKAGAIIQREGIADVVFLGSPGKIKSMIAGMDVSLDGIEILDYENNDILGQMADEYNVLRAKEKLTKDQAVEVMRNPLYFGAMMVKKGMVGGMTCGAWNTTAEVLRASIKIIGPQKGIKTVSSCFLMIVPDCPYGADGAFIYADCGTVIDPNEQQLADIAVAAAGMCRMLIGVEPLVAMLSFSTKGSAKHACIDKVVEATRLAKEMAPDLKIDGELQGDSALIASIGEKKCPGSPVAGKANVLVFPDLDAGNIAYKLTQRLAKADAYGPLVQGLALPVNDLSRGCSTEDIVQVSAVTAIEAQVMKSK